MNKPVLLAVTAAVALTTGCFSTIKSQEKLDTQSIASWTQFDYTDWIMILKTYVNEIGKVNYAALKANRKPLDRFVSLLGSVGPKTRPDLFKSRNDKLAYYINAYNALTMFNVINRLPKMKSVNDDIKSFFYFTEFPLDGRSLSLYNLENKLIRPEFNEPRIHFALNCASIGCPQLPNTAFLPKTLDEQLARETQKFLHEARNVNVEEGWLVLSTIFKWYKEDFPPSVIKWINKEAPDLKLLDDAAVKYRAYDWTLNTQ